MKKKWTILMLVSAALALLIAVGPAGAATIVVHPTGQFPDDVASVQAAVDQGGTVLLKATNGSGQPMAFNFGPPRFGSGRVNLGGTVAVVGERAGSAMTTIDGGAVPFRVLPGANAQITGIDFEAPFAQGIRLLDPASADIVGNRIAHVVGADFGFTLAEGIVSFYGGRIAIRDNVIEDLDGEFGFGIDQALARGNVEIVGNHVSGTNTIAIWPAQNLGTVRISQNTVEPGPERFSFGSEGVGIEVEGAGAYQILDNTIVCEIADSACIVAVGSDVLGSGPLVAPIIQRNYVVTRAPFPGSGLVGILLLGQVNDAFVGQNRIEGNGFAALSLLDTPADRDLGTNTFVGNNIARFTSDVADVFLDTGTHDTVLAGRSGTVIDLGINNRITGFNHGGDSQIGLQIGQAIALRNQSIHEALRSARAAARTP